ncbi:uncharacterized protein LOC133176801 isoform X2 [Saccostrea echinata]|uniref:uncharacterized protein LOC133176801 isoform X2 n=1 Tax=Saccostrea echinata TaxID=191078 RepID=UPI002A8033AB|nr:uncharacterized protein LOC133176801 isoform X2 [Saccostrea echinata]
MKRKISSTDLDAVEVSRPAKRRRIEVDNQTDRLSAFCHRNQTSDNRLILAQNEMSSAPHNAREKEMAHMANKQTSNANLQKDRVRNPNLSVDDQKAQPSQINRLLLWLLNIYPNKPRIVLKPPPIPQQSELNEPSLSSNVFQEGTTKISEDLPSSSAGLTILAKTALSASDISCNYYPTNSTETDVTTITEGVKIRSSKLDRLLYDLVPSGHHSEARPGSSNQSVWHKEPVTPSNSAQLPFISESTRKRRKGVPQKRPSLPSQATSAEVVPNKKVKWSDNGSSVKKAPEKVLIRPPQTLIGQYRRKPEVSRNEKNREIDSKDAHKMKYPSYLHEWLERVKFNHTRKWQMFKYSEPKWTAWQLAQTSNVRGSSKHAY